MCDKEKGNCQATTDPVTNQSVCSCEDESCNCNTITLELEDGTEKEFVVLDMIEHNGKTYMALSEDDSEEYDILKVEGDEENMELIIIEDDAEYNEIADIFDSLFADEEEEEEEK